MCASLSEDDDEDDGAATATAAADDDDEEEEDDGTVTGIEALRGMYSANKVQCALSASSGSGAGIDPGLAGSLAWETGQNLVSSKV